MEINRQQFGDIIEVRLKGRLDSYWSDYLADHLKDAVHKGANHIQVNMSHVAYMSSAGIRVLLKYYKQLKSMNGSFTVTQPSESVKTIIDLSGISALLFSSEAVAVHPDNKNIPQSKIIDYDNLSIELFDLAPSEEMRCSLIGTPNKLETASFQSEDCHSVQISDSSVALGIGAIGDDFCQRHGFPEECRYRFGEFLAAGGAVVYLPTDGTNVPDYLVSTGTLVPELRALYALNCEGNFSHQFHFNEKNDSNALTLTDLVTTSFEITGCDNLCMVIIAESIGLVGVSLRQSPTTTITNGLLYDQDLIRDWLSFSSTRTHSQSLTLVVGVASKSKEVLMHPFLRSIGDRNILGHFHAAAFSYRPIQKGFIDLKKMITNIFEVETLQGVLHIINDDRGESGHVIVSGFTRGACWIGKIPDKNISAAV